MVKLNIDTGERNSRSTAARRPGGGVCVFNPSDPNVYNRFFLRRGTA